MDRRNARDAHELGSIEFWTRIYKEVRLEAHH